LFLFFCFDFFAYLYLRINKRGSQKDQEQKKSGNYFFYDDGADDEDDDEDFDDL
jgi:sarcosine oxidase delta subunit